MTRVPNRVAILESPGNIRLGEETIEGPGKGELLVKVKACGICSGDIFAFKGYPVWFSLPAKIGHEASGVVVEVGEGVEEFRPGDRVTFLGGPAFADYLTVPAGSAVKIPANVAFEHALGEPLACVVNGVRLARPRAGDRVAVVGTGFMGLLITQALSKMPLEHLAAVDVLDQRLELARKYGASVTFNVGEGDVKRLLSECGDFDIVVEATGSPAGVAVASQLVRRQGLLCIFSYHPNPVPVDFKVWDAKGIEVVMTSPARAEDMNANLRRAVSLLSRGVFDMRDLVTHKWRLEEIQEAFRYASAKPPEYIKGCIVNV